ncbi:hypothetical protein AAFC00_005546 [Neodothiora populina]|uniref:14-3-3 domain-containing protein n=1 Tax=Neodothiora populina TaxID=2781224 RepID=A0ABR3PL88_9PEZI
MAVSAVDLRILGQVAEDTMATNALLSSCLFQILGLSVILAQQLTKARSQRKLDYTRNTKSIKLYHHIIWLAREGLSITEVLILPYCQDGGQGPECRVMAAKLRASFYHIFCLFHNHPPVFQLKPNPSSQHLRPPQSNISKQSAGDDRTTHLKPDTGLRDSIVSESSYVTNPFEASAQSPPPSYPIPPLPTTPARKTPSRPPGLSPQQRSPPSSATYLLPPLNFVPAADSYFKLTFFLASRLLRGAHPLRLSVIHEYTAFLQDCVKDYSLARQVAGDAVRAAYLDEGDLSDKEWEEVLMMVRALTITARRTGGSEEGYGSKSSQGTSSDDARSRRGPTRPLPTPPVRAPAVEQIPLAVQARVSNETTSTTPRSATLVNSPNTAVFDPEGKDDMRSLDRKRSAEERAKRSQTSSRSSGRGRQEGAGSEKERKRRAVERAESELFRKRSGQTRVSNISNMATRRR